MRARTWLAWVGLLLSPSAMATCPPEGTDVPSLRLLKEQGFAVSDDVRNTLVAGLPACLSDPYPNMRDGVA